jgi:hypothetical protein
MDKRDSIFSGNGGDGKIDVLQACTVLYDSLPVMDAVSQQVALERLVGPCTVEWSGVGPAGVAGASLMGGVAAFGDHRVALVALAAPVRQEVLDVTVDVSPMPGDRRLAFARHGAAVRVLYIGSASDPVQQLTALYSVASVLLGLGGLGIINERAALAQPAELAAGLMRYLGDDAPPIQLWTGVVTFSLGETGGISRYLLRTYGMDQSALPEVAIYIADRMQADDAYHTLMNVALYLVQNRPTVQLGVGDRVDFAGRTYLLTDPDSDASEFASETGLLLLVEV